MNPASLTARNKNARNIVDFILKHGEASRVMLANVLGLSRSTVTVIVAELIEQGLLYESHPGQTQVGRRSTMLRFNADWCYLLSVELGNNADDVTCFNICNLDGTLVTKGERSFYLKVQENQTTTSVLRELIQEIKIFLDKQSKKIREKIRACGVCVAGSVDNYKMVDMEYLNWDLTNILAPLQAAFNFPVFLEGVTRIKAIYEMRFIDPAERTVLYLNISDGVGMVTFFNGQMVTGRFGLAGEVGHICLNKDGPKCYCGNNGCFEYYCSINQQLRRLAKGITELPPSDPLYELVVGQEAVLDKELMFHAMEQGSLAVHEVFEEMSDYLGIGISTMVNIYDPDRIIITGYLDGHDDSLIENSVRKARARVCQSLARSMQISRAHLPNNQTHLAVSAYVLSQLLTQIFPT